MQVCHAPPHPPILHPQPNKHTQTNTGLFSNKHWTAHQWLMDQSMNETNQIRPRRAPALLSAVGGPVWAQPTCCGIPRMTRCRRCPSPPHAQAVRPAASCSGARQHPCEGTDPPPTPVCMFTESVCECVAAFNISTQEGQGEGGQGWASKSRHDVNHNTQKHTYHTHITFT